jgi:hypothetical protein
VSRPRFAAALVLAVLVAGTVLALAVAGCGRPAEGVADEQAAERVYEYFAGDGARFVTGIDVRDVVVADGPQGRMLSVKFVSTGPDESDGRFTSLYYGSAGSDGWTGDLNRLGLGIVQVSMEFHYADGGSDSLQVDIARQSIAGSTRLRPGPATTAWTTTTAPAANSQTTITEPIVIPPDLTQFAPMVEQLTSQSVSVSRLLPLPPDPSYGSGVQVVLRTSNVGPRLNPEDVIGSAWVLRAAVDAKMSGVDIDSVGVAYERPSGAIDLSSVEPVDRIIDAEWFEPPGMTLDEVVERVRDSVTAALTSSAFHLDALGASVESDSTRVISAAFTVDSMAALNEANAGPNAVADAVDRLNAANGAKIGVLRTDVRLPSGEPLTSTLTDLQLTRGTSWFAEGVQPEGPTPATTVSWPVDPTGLVRQFFAGAGAQYVKGLTIDSLQVTPEGSGLVLRLAIRSDGSEEQLWTLFGLVFTSAEGPWARALKAETGIALVWLHAEVTYPDGYTDITDVDMVSGALSSKGGAPRFHIGGPDTTAAP